MATVAEKQKSIITEAVERLISRADEARSLTGSDLEPRVAAAVEKYVLGPQPGAANNDIKAFIDELRSDDLCLVIACERGDGRAWEDLVAKFDSTVKSAARKISSNAEDAEDLASSIWAELYGMRAAADGTRKSKLAYYSGRGSLAGWLRAVVAQLAVDQFRKESRFVQIEEDREFEALANEAAEKSDSPFGLHTQNPEQLFSDGQSASDVSAALGTTIAALEAEDRLILKLYYADELKLKDIAATFGFHEATASRKLTRIQADIRKGVERALCAQYGWTDGEVKRHLSDTAAGLGLNLETMFAVLSLVVLVQDFGM